MPKAPAPALAPADATVDALEMRPALPPPDPEISDADAMFPALPKELGVLNDFAAATSETLTRGRMKATALLIMRQQGYNRREIGRMLGMTPNAVRVALNRARHAGKLNDLRNVLENDSAALAIESLNFHLKKKDKDATFKTLEGLGHFKRYTHGDGASGPAFQMPALTVTVVNAPNHQGQQLVSAPVGAPREDKAP